MKTRRAIICISLVFCFLMASAAEAGVSIVGGLTHQKQATPGEVYKGSILIENIHSGEPVEVKIYQTDYHFRFDGTNDYGPPGELERSNANWIRFSPHRPIIAPNDVSTVNYTVRVPDDPNLVGTYWSMIMVEGVPKSSRESSQAENAKPQVTITQIMRYGIQVITHIGETGERKIEFLQTKLLRESDKRVLQVDIENTGERWLRLSLWTELYDESGSYTGKFEARGKRTYPGTSARFKVDLSDVPEGEYKALVVADGGGDDIFGAHYSFKFEK